MHNEFAKCEIKTSVFSGRKSQVGNCCRNGPSPSPTPAGGPVAKPEINTADRLRSRERAGGELACLFQQPDLEKHWEPMRNRALPSVMAFLARATHPAGALLRDRQPAARP